ncbi:NGG1p interacting factor NIF3 [Patescibacteria group bacterium]|nr:NGG1p interacting factor NIF3 [Patescibacteria group bacterium]
MFTQEIYKLAIEMGIKNDLRGDEVVKKYLDRVRKTFNKLDEKAKQKFDLEKLVNPFADTRILNDNNSEIKKLLIGIDIEGSELLLAKQLGNIDLVIAHHPEGKALADMHSVMDMQAQILAQYGVPINIAESVLKERIAEVDRNLSPTNHNRFVDFAKLLNINFACIHTPCDNMGATFLDKLFTERKPEYIEDILEILNEIPEYKRASEINAGPKIFAGSPQNSCGRIVVTEFTGGTNGSKEMYEKMSQAGIGTIISMHMGEAHKKEAEKAHINVVVAGHISSDSLGINLFLDELEKRNIEIVTCSGITRVKRN